MKGKFFFTLMIISAFSTFAHTEENVVPAWCYWGSWKDKDGFYAVGVGNSELEADLGGILDLVRLCDCLVSSSGEKTACVYGNAKDAAARLEFFYGDNQKEVFSYSDVAYAMKFARRLERFVSEGEGLVYVQVFMPEAEFKKLGSRRE